MSASTDCFHVVPVLGFAIPQGMARPISKYLNSLGLQLRSCGSMDELQGTITQFPEALVFVGLTEKHWGSRLAELATALDASRTIVIALAEAGFDSLHYRACFEMGVIDILRAPLNDLLLRNRCRVYIELQQRRSLERKEKQLIKRLERQRDQLLAALRDGVLITTGRGYIIEINDFALSTLGYGREQLIGAHISQLLCHHQVADPTLDWIEHPIYPAFSNEPYLDLEDISLWRLDGTELPVDCQVILLDDSEEAERTLLFQDISVRKTEEGKLDQLTRYDAVTGLANASLMRHFLLKAMARALRNDRKLAIVYLDLDDFHCINQNFGYKGGDVLLKSIGRRIKSCIRTGDLVSRYEEDGFMVVLDEIRKTDDAAKLAKQMLEKISQPHDLNGVPVVAHASIGIALYPSGAIGIDELIDHARFAKDWVKKHGKNGVREFSDESLKHSDIRKLVH